MKNNQKYAYNDLGPNLEHVITIKTSKQIIDEYFPIWEKKMIEKWGESSSLITKENCIEDWKIIHYAWEVDE